MNMKKLAVMALCLAVSAPTFATLRVTPRIEIESNTLDNKDNKENPSMDTIYLGLRFQKALPNDINLDLEVKSYDRAFFEDTKQVAPNSSVDYTQFFITKNRLVNIKDGLRVDLGAGVRIEDNMNNGSSNISYRISPNWQYPLADKLTLTGGWLFYVTNQDTNARIDNTVRYRHELNTGIRYTGIDNYTITASVFTDYQQGLGKVGSTRVDDQYEKHVVQLRTGLSTNVAGYTVAPWVRLQLGEAQIKNGETGKKANDGETSHRLGLDVSKTINNIRYSGQTYVDKLTYDDESKDRTRTYLSMAATYTF